MFYLILKPKSLLARLCVLHTASQHGASRRLRRSVAFGRCGILESSESWVLYDSLRMIVYMTEATVHMTSAYNSNIEDNIRVTRGPAFYITRYLNQRLPGTIMERLLAIGIRPTNKGIDVTLVRERA